MTDRLRIAVADDERDMQEYFLKMLPRIGHEVVSVASTGVQLVEQCRQFHPDLVISDIKMPELDGIEAAESIHREMAIPIILVSAYHDVDLIHRAEADHIMAYLVKPIKQADLAPAITLAVRRFQQLQAVQDQANELRRTVEDRQLVEQATGLLMREAGCDERAALQRLQQLADAKNRELVEVAKKIVSGDGTQDT